MNERAPNMEEIVAGWKQLGELSDEISGTIQISEIEAWALLLMTCHGLRGFHPGNEMAIAARGALDRLLGIVMDRFAPDAPLLWFVDTQFENSMPERFQRQSWSTDGLDG